MKNKEQEPTLFDKQKVLRDQPRLTPETHPGTAIFAHEDTQLDKETIKVLRKIFQANAENLSQLSLRWERKREKRGQPRLTPEDIEREKANEAKIIQCHHFCELMDQEIAFANAELLDTYKACYRLYYEALCDQLGFEQIDTIQEDFMGLSGSELYVFARADGLILTWDTYKDNISSARLYYQTVAGATDKAEIYHGSRVTVIADNDGPDVECVALSVAEDLRETVQLIEDRVGPLSPFYVPPEQTLLPSNVAKCLDRAPLWVRQMVGLAEIKQGQNNDMQLKSSGFRHG